MDSIHKFWTEVHRGLRLSEVGVPASEFASDPLGVIGRLAAESQGRRWLAQHQVEATALSDLLVDGSNRYGQSPARVRGVREHAAHAALSKRFHNQ